MSEEESNIDNVQRILLATSAINYMAHTIRKVQKEVELIAPRAKEVTGYELSVHTDCAKFLAEAIKRLSEIANDMGDFMNGHDMVMPEDEKATKWPFKVLNHKL